MKSQAERLVYSFRASRVKRWHTHSYMIYEDTVGHHSHGVAMILLILHPAPSAALLKAALIHDLGEKKVGDMSHWVKKDNPALRDMLGDLEDKTLEENLCTDNANLVNEDIPWLKAADALHAWMVLRENLMCGNNAMLEVYQRLTLDIEKKVQGGWPLEILSAMNDLSGNKLWYDF